MEFWKRNWIKILIIIIIMILLFRLGSLTISFKDWIIKINFLLFVTFTLLFAHLVFSWRRVLNFFKNIIDGNIDEK